MLNFFHANDIGIYVNSIVNIENNFEKILIGVGKFFKYKVSSWTINLLISYTVYIISFKKDYKFTSLS